MDRVSGVDFLEPGKYYRLPVFWHHAIVFPGEQIPMIISEHMFEASEFMGDHEDGCLFGLVFKNTRFTNDVLGVTCQVYEKGHTGEGNVIIKARSYQRFIVDESELDR